MQAKRVVNAYLKKMSNACVQYKGNDRVRFMEPLWESEVNNDSESVRARLDVFLGEVDRPADVR
jgi:hypothetical protein